MMVIQLKNLEGVMAALQQLPAEVVSKGGGPVKRALRKGGLPILQAVQANLRRVLAQQRRAGKPTAESTGLLLKAARITRGKPPRDQKGERYLVRFSRLRYPDRKGKVVTTLKSGQILEYGSEKQLASPYIRPAYLSRAQQALEIVERELVAEIDRIARRLARKP